MIDFSFFFLPNSLARTSSTMLTRRDESEHSRLIPDFGGRIFRIQSVANNDVRCGFFVDAVYHIEEFPFYS